MTFARFHPEAVRLRNDRISEADGLRQEAAAAELLKRFDHQPGVILADEVGMGKTFVALATAVSVVIDRADDGPVVVMCPASLKHKWPRDWDVFREKCLDASLRDHFRAASAASGIDFLRLLDDPDERRNHIIFLTHGALHRGLNDSFAKLGVIRRAFRGRSSLARQRASFQRFAGSLLRVQWIERRAPGLLGDLLDRPFETWLRTIHRADPTLREVVTDDPVPAHLAAALDAMPSSELEQVVEALRALPLRESRHIEARLRTARQVISEALEVVWKLALQQASFHSPLLILDEAHHVKNPGTRLASLFATEESAQDAGYFASAGPLGGKFSRMLFLTATPFQLGHMELINVLERFEGVAWEGRAAPRTTSAEFRNSLKQLRQALDDAQAAALRLDRAWSRLDPSHLLDDNGQALDPDEWWERVRKGKGGGSAAHLVEQVGRAREKMAQAEQLLAAWVLRYVKPKHLPNALDIERRRVLPGAAILDGGVPTTGIGISGPVVLPFLLAGRAQALLANSTRGRAFFAEGLSSSFEAYLETRSDGPFIEEDFDRNEQTVAPPELAWYLEHLDRVLPRRRSDIRSAHPKLRATAERAVALWKRGEKVLVFCHYRATGRALRQHISTLLHGEILQLAREQVPDVPLAELERHLSSLGDRFGDDRRLGRVAREWTGELVRHYPQLAPWHDKIVDVFVRFMRTRSFLVRYLPLGAADVAEEFVTAVEHRSVGTQSLRAQIEHFCAFLSERCIAAERNDILDALDKVQTGTHVGRDVRAAFDPRELHHSGSHHETVLLPNVRLANGEVRAETRQRLLRTFNSPLFPEILIASSVMGEGVDLHLYCRFVIHHDLCWNPSTLEQRSGRVDRIGCKAERDRQSIHLYLPYLTATQDEKMYRVVRDRERWFQVIMGERYSVDERATDLHANRILLPAQIAQELTMKLHP